ncbi:DEDD exonuclease domain-containing protein [Catenuloplanes indicus JCM 9534]|uniref:DNA polymerase-3 subunit epsilon n=2 Tax=Catenuloplanes indicus TaxID=137267 RepID=A0AAE4AX94_9ACTN|nr:DNA polymerase-3 subunit epsilon [Catenuloplanes indicus]
MAQTENFVQGLLLDDDDPGSMPLSGVTFVVVDLETTGGAPAKPDGSNAIGITEIGAVKVRGGEELGVFGTLVNPGEAIPPFITVLTGITEAMLAPAPPIEEVLPAFLEFVRGAVLVAHNAPYDVGFLKAACARLGYDWPPVKVLDTAALARRALTRDEVPNRKLGTLAAFFRAQTTPTHRALDDARATVEVLHGLFDRMGSHNVSTLGEAIEFGKAVTPTQRRKKHLAEDLPKVPGVYVFRAADDRPLYVGTSVDIATRVRSYFTAAEKRARMSEMLNAAVRVEAIECAHGLEAEVRELRLIAAHAPPYNRRSKFPERVVWLKLTTEVFPRLSMVRALADDGGTYLGPFSSRRAAELAASGVYDAIPVRQCGHKLSVRVPMPACALAELGKCPAPCEHRVTVDEYDAMAATPFRTAVTGDPGPLITALMTRIENFSSAQRYEEAAVLRGRMAALLRALIRMQRLSGLTSQAELVAARPHAGGGWDLAIVRHGRLAAAGVSPPRVHPRPTIESLRLTAETVLPGPGPTPAATAEESERILAWLERPETRLVEMTDTWSSPVRGAARFGELLARAEGALSANNSAVRS